MEKAVKPFYKRWWFIVIAALFVIGLIGGILESDESKQERATEEQAASQKRIDDREAKKEAREKEAEKAMKEVEEAEKAIEQLPIDERLIKKDNYVDRAEFTEPGFLEVFHITQTSLKDVIAREEVYELFKDFKEAFSDPEVTGVKATILNEGKNAEGENVSETMIIVVYYKETFDDLDFDSFIKSAKDKEWLIYNASDEYYLYPSIFRNVDEDFMDKLTSGVSKVPPITE